MPELRFRQNGMRDAIELAEDAELDLDHPAVRRAANRLREIEAAKRAAERSERDRRKPPKPRQPPRARFSAITSGRYKRQKRPVTNVSDRMYVPAALVHWRKVHGLSQRQAGARIGYSVKSCSWQHWELGFSAPPYATLLRIIAATGLGHWTDDEGRRSMDATLRLQADRARWAQGMRSRRHKRQRAKSAS